MTGLSFIIKTKTEAYPGAMTQIHGSYEWKIRPHATTWKDSYLLFLIELIFMMIFLLVTFIEVFGGSPESNTCIMWLKWKSFLIEISIFLLRISHKNFLHSQWYLPNDRMDTFWFDAKNNYINNLKEKQFEYYCSLSNVLFYSRLSGFTFFEFRDMQSYIHCSSFRVWASQIPNLPSQLNILNDYPEAATIL